MIYILLSLLTTTSLFGASKELRDLETLIHSTEELVVREKTLRTDLEEYLSLHDSYLLDMENKELLMKTATKAKKILEKIKAEKMSPLFDPSFISEMTLFAKLAKSPSIPPLP